ncbi:FYVE zinc finger-domain-containing protein [Biscogniauxia sp. FL1348]|nr:FYVE zinc finger-domain-containing protein [Biscogniauxia sp. FL1348]
MSSVDSGGHVPPRTRTAEEDHNSSDAESGSSYVGSGAPDTPSCPYQTSAFFGHECSCYFDCPTHLIERTSRDGGGDRAGPSVQPTSNDDIQVSEPSQQPVETGEVAPTAGESTIELPVSEATQHLDTDPASSPVAPVTATEHDSAQPTSGITLQEALAETTESLEQLSIEEPPSTEEPPSPRENAGEGFPQQPSRQQLDTMSQSSGRPSSRLSSMALPPSPQAQRRGPPDFVVPRWQPDAEVTYCPICRTQFSIFVRKHHCRKCGRVVCNSCSPHRIILPHQFIVRQPGERGYYTGYSFLAGEGGIAEFSSLGGGERVRLCNPCVPDPNTSPPQPQQSPNPYLPGSSHRRTQSSSSSIFATDGRSNSLSPRYPSNPLSPRYSSNPAGDTFPRNRSATLDPGPASLIWEPPPDNRVGSHVPSFDLRHLTRTSRRQSAMPPYAQSLIASVASRAPRELSSFFDLPNTASSSSSAAAMNRPLPPPPQIPEEDECPICHHELPSRNLPNFESLRESHITLCITAHSTYSPRPAIGSGQGGHSTPPPRTARRTGMFPYLATEKDCVDSAECTICLEEFEVGVPMARLECLCRFHRSCINEWFVDHPGRCPVHQHDSFGY